MEVRSYYSTTVEAAMATARKELGPEAMLVQSRQSPPELQHLGRYEVVFAGELQRLPEKAAPVNPVKPLGLTRKASPAEAAISGKLKLTDPPAQVSRLMAIPDIGPINLLDGSNEMDDPEAAAFLSRFAPEPIEEKVASKRIAPVKAKAALREVTDPVGELTRKIRCLPGLSREHTQSVALIGPSGAGKTSTIMKLALLHGTLQARAVRLLSHDARRVGASAGLKHFAGLLQIPFQECESAEELSGALTTHFHGLTLVDTSGFGKQDAEGIYRLQRCFGEHAGLQCHIVLRADRTNAANLAALERFSILSPERLILTALDEAPRLDGLRVLIMQSGLPVSFLGLGQRIPEDLEAASPRRVAELIVNGWPASERAAA